MGLKAIKAGRKLPAFLLVLALVTLMSGCANPNPFSRLKAPAQGALLTAQAQPLDEAGFARLAAAYDYVLLGEGHALPCDHKTQATLLAAMLRDGQRPALGFEMVPAVNDPILERYLRGDIPPDQLAAALDWKNAWGFPFSLYAPLFELARTRTLPLAGLNMDQDGVRLFRDHGFTGLDPARQALLPHDVPGGVIPPPPAQAEMLRAEFAAHAEIFGQSNATQARLERFQAVQSLWDTVMAEQARRLREASGRPVVLILGSGHVEYGFGVKHRLSILDPAAKVLLVNPWRGDADQDPDEADVFYYCPLRHVSHLGYVLEVRDGNLTVAEVTPGSKADVAGLRPGDVLLKADSEPVHGLWDLHKAGLRAGESGRALTFEVSRTGQAAPLTVNLPLSGTPAPHPGGE